MHLEPFPTNKSLIKVFYHDSSNGDWFSIDELYYAKSSNKLNLLGNITDEYKINGYFEFIIDYGNIKISWKQKKNIKDTTSTDTSESIGYINNGVEHFGGLIRSDYPNNALYDGIHNSKRWWFCVGAMDNTYSDYTFPGVFYSESNTIRTKTITVWMKINPKLMFKTCKTKRNYLFIAHFLALIYIS